MADYPKLLTLEKISGIAWLSQSEQPYCLLDSMGYLRWANNAWRQQVLPDGAPLAQDTFLRQIQPYDNQRESFLSQLQGDVKFTYYFQPLPDKGTGSAQHKIELIPWDGYPQEKLWIGACKVLPKMLPELVELGQQTFNISALVDQSEDIFIFKTDKSGQFTYLNPHFCRQLGISHELALGVPALQHIHPSDHQTFKDALKNAFLHPGKEIEVDLRLVNPATQDQLITRWDIAYVDAIEEVPAGYICLGIDITDLKETQDQLRNIVDNLSDVIIQLDEAGVIKYISPPWERSFEYSISETLGKPFLEIIPEDYRPKIQEILDRKPTSSDNITCVHKLDLPAGGWIWVESKIASSTSPRGYAVIIRNINSPYSEHIQLQQHKVMMESAGEIARIGGWTFNAVTGEIKWTRETYRIKGVDFDFIPTLENVLDFYPEPDRQKLQNAIQQAIEEGKPYDLELNLINGHGEKRIVRAMGKPYRKDGITIRLDGIEQDITEAKLESQIAEKEQDLLKRTQQAARLGAWEFDIDQDKIYWTEEVYRIHEVDMDFDPNLIRDESFSHPKDIAQYRTVLFETINERKECDLVNRIITATGKEIWIKTTMYPIIQGDRVTHVRGLFQDITEQKENELALKQSEQLLRKLTNNVPGTIFQMEMTPDGEMTFPFLSEGSRILDSSKDLNTLRENGLMGFDRIPEEHWATMMEEIKKTMQDPGRCATFEYQIWGVQQLRWARMLYTSEQKPDGTMVWYGFAHDITEQKEAELTVKQSEEQLRKLTTNVPGTIFQMQMDQQGKITFPFLSEGTQLFGENVDRNEIRGDALLSFEYLHEEDRPMLMKSIQDDLASPGEVNVKEFRVNPPGSPGPRWVRNMSVCEILPDGVAVWYGFSHDITESKKTEEQLKRTTLQLINAQNLTQTASYEGHIESRKMTVSPNFYEIFGLRDQQVNSIDDILPFIMENEVEPIIQNYFKAVNTHEAFNNEIKCRRPDGSEFLLINRSRLYFDENNQPSRILGSIQDITQQRESQKALKESEEKLRHLTDNLDEVFWLRSEDDTAIKYISPAYEKIWGRSCQDLYDDPDDYLKYIHPDDLEKVKETYRRFAETGLYEMEHRLIGPDGITRWVLARQQAVEDGNGNVVSQVGFASDITEKKQKEEQLKLLQTVVEKAQDSVLITEAAPITQDEDGPRVVYANPAFYRMTGYSPEEVIGTTPRFLQGPKTDQLELQKIHKALDNWETIEVELVNYKKDGTEYWTNLIITPIADDTGWYTHWVSIQRDVTQRKIHEIELVKAKNQAEKASQAKSEFLSTMSHEIRTPLNAIIGMTGLLDDTQLDEDQQYFLRTIRQGGETLLSVINDILDYSKIESGHMELEQEKFDLVHPVEETLELLADKAHSKGLELLYEVIDPVPKTVIGDVTRIRQILVNLVGNAIKFTTEGEVVVTVKQLEEKVEKVTLELSVRDTGEGIPKEKLNRLFRSFSQVDASTTRKHGGTGLGLAISKRLVELHGGSIRVESEVGQGTTFTFTIRLDLDQEGASTQDIISEKRVKGTVWLVDDNETNLNIQARLLKKVGLTPREFDSPTSVLETINQDNIPDLMVLDFNMPDLDGVQLGQKIKERFPDIPLMLLSSGNNNYSSENRSIFSRVMQKPVRNDQYLKRVYETLSSTEKKVVPHEAGSTSGNVDLSDFTILLVEDNAINQKVAQRMLLKFRARVEIANNGAEALEFVQMRDFDLVLMDMQMPVMDGVEATIHIRNLEAIEQPIILAMTANASNDDRLKCINAGMNDFLPKPIRIEALRDHLVKWLKPQKV